MTKEELIALGLTDEQAGKVLDGYKGYVPKTRFDEVNEAKKTAESQLVERDKQLETLKKSSGDMDALKAEITKLQEKNKTDAAEYAAALKAMQINNAVERELMAAGAKNVKATKALLELDKAEMDGDTVKGLAEQIKKLKGDESSKFLFNEEKSNQLKGLAPGQKKDNAPGETASEGASYAAKYNAQFIVPKA